MPLSEEVHLHEATALVQDLLADGRGLFRNAGGFPSADDLQDQLERNKRVIQLAVAGDLAAGAQVREWIGMAMDKYHIQVKNMTRDEAVWAIYRYAYSVDVLYDVYYDDEIDEIQVNAPDQVWVQRRGRLERSEARFRDDEHLAKIIRRMIQHDRVRLDLSTPGAESVRLDGTRITAMIPPFTARPTLVVRKQRAIFVTPEAFIAANSIDKVGIDLLRVLVLAGCNIVISGGTNTAKSSLLRVLVGFYPPELRVVTLESDRELFLAQHYPDRGNIVEFEAHDDIGFNMREAFRYVLRCSPDSIMVGEVRGKGEATEAVKAAERGHERTMFTVHVTKPEEVPLQVAMMRIEEGTNVPLELLEREFTAAYDVIVHMERNPATGLRRVSRICALDLDSTGRPVVRDLYRADTSRGYWAGGWTLVDTEPGPKIREKLARHGVEAQWQEVTRC